MSNWFYCHEINEETFQIVAKLKECGYHLYLLSNISHDVWNYFQTQEKNNLFDGKVLSYQVETMKPDDEIYHILLKKYNLIAEECLFIDDKQENIAPANNLGIQGRQVNPDDPEDVIKILNEYKIKI